MRWIVMLAALVVVTGCSVFGVRSGYEQPPYEVVETFGDKLEIRRYGPRLAAEAVVEAEDESKGRNQAFRLLFRYITGANRAQDEIAMTAPVAVERAEPSEADEGAEIAMTVPVQTEWARGGGAGQSRMLFFLPSSFTEATAPTPTHEAVRVFTVEPETVAALRFTGFWSQTKVARKTDELLTALRETGWTPNGPVSTQFYDPPFTIPWLRRNEVVVAVARAE